MKSSGEEEEVGKRNKYERKMKEKRKGKRGEGRGGKGGHHYNTLPAEGNLPSYVATITYLELIFKNI